MTPRLVLVWLHRWAGLTLAAFLVMAGLTGSVLAFNEDLDAWLNPDLFDASPGPALPLDRVIAAVERQGGRVLRVSYPTPVRGSVMVGVAAPGYDTVFVDPATARILGHRDSGGCCLSARVVMPFLFRFHYTLAVGQVGQWLMGGMAALWTLDCFVGLWLTLPRIRPFLARWWPMWRIKPTANSFRLTLDLHRAGGLWCWTLLLIMAISGVALTLRTELFRPVVSTLFATTPDIPPRPVPGGPALSFGEAVDRAAAVTRPDMPVFVYYGAGMYGVALQQPGVSAESGLGPDWVYVDGQTGTVLRTDKAGHGRPGDTILQAQYPLHSGQIAGLAGRITVCLLGLVVAMLAITGVLVWWRKRRARKRHDRVGKGGRRVDRRFVRDDRPCKCPSANVLSRSNRS